MIKTLCHRRFAEYASYVVADSELERRHGSRIHRDQYGRSERQLSMRPRVRLRDRGRFFS